VKKQLTDIPVIRLFLRDIKLKDLKLGTRRGPLETPPPGDKKTIIHYILVFDQATNLRILIPSTPSVGDFELLIPKYRSKAEEL